MEKRDIRTNLIDLRTHLTVANLASAQLRRKAGHSEESARLFAHLDRSLKQIERDALQIERTLDEAERRDARVPNPFRILFGVAAASALAAKMRQMAQGRGRHELLRSLP